MVNLIGLFDLIDPKCVHVVVKGLLVTLHALGDREPFGAVIAEQSMESAEQMNDLLDSANLKGFQVHLRMGARYRVII